MAKKHGIINEKIGDFLEGDAGIHKYSSLALEKTFEEFYADVDSAVNRVLTPEQKIELEDKFKEVQASSVSSRDGIQAEFDELSIPVVLELISMGYHEADLGLHPELIYKNLAKAS